jgi:probable F420-dependent oxidoreductase
VHFGLMGAQRGRGCEQGGIAEVARLAEDLGFESLWTPEHIVLPGHVESRYPFNAEGRLHSEPSDCRPDPIIWLAFAAATTKHIRLGTGVIVLPLRNPLLLAKETATLDAISGGRLILGVGLGWMREEFAALRSQWTGRATRTEEYIAAMRALWADSPSSFDGATVSFRDVYCSPQPRRHRIPIVISGTSDTAARRAGRIGDGYLPMAVSEQRLCELLGIARAAAENAGRDWDDIEVTYLGAADHSVIEGVTKLGVDRYIVIDRSGAIARSPEQLAPLAESLDLQPR